MEAVGTGKTLGRACVLKVTLDEEEDGMVDEGRETLGKKNIIVRKFGLIEKDIFRDEYSTTWGETFVTFVSCRVS